MTETLGTPQNLLHQSNWKPWEVNHSDEFNWHYYTDKGARHEGFETLGAALAHVQRDLLLLRAGGVQGTGEGPCESDCRAEDLLCRQGRSPDHATFKSRPAVTMETAPPQPPAPAPNTPQTGRISGQTAGQEGAVDALGEECNGPKHTTTYYPEDGRFTTLRKGREEKYGPPKANFDNIGLAWTAQLQAYFRMELPSVIPGYVVAQMQAAMKVVRAGHSNMADTYIDGEHYLHLAQLVDDREQLK